jgi:hypothetical protein
MERRTEHNPGHEWDGCKEYYCTGPCISGALDLYSGDNGIQMSDGLSVSSDFPNECQHADSQVP